MVVALVADAEPLMMTVPKKAWTKRRDSKMGEEEPPTDFTAPIVAWLLRSKLVLGIVIGIFLAPTMDRSTNLVLNRLIPRENNTFGDLAGEIPAFVVETQRLDVLTKLVQSRHILDGASDCPPTLEFVQALNIVPLLFAEETDVVNNYNILMQDSGRSPVAFASMLFTMAEALEIQAPVLAQKGFPYQCE